MDILGDCNETELVTFTMTLVNKVRVALSVWPVYMQLITQYQCDLNLVLISL